MSNVVPMQMYVAEGQLHTEYAVDSCKSREEINKLLEVSLGKGFSVIEFRKGQRTATGMYRTKDGSAYYFMVANLTFMGGTEGQHPRDLKRIQYNLTWRDFYEEYSDQGRVLWMGLYSYKNTNVWAFFEPETYLKKHEGTGMISKGGHKAQYSCHIFLNDLYQGIESGSFRKLDKNGNTVGAVDQNCLARFFNYGMTSSNPIIEAIKTINESQVNWNTWITASSAIPYMRALKSVTGFNQWKQNMWNGWYIEALYSEYLHDHPSEYIDYVATTKNKNVLIEYSKSGLDLAFPDKSFHFIGDLKAICEGDGDTLLNDETNVKDALTTYKRIWFVLYIHSKKKGSTNDYEMVKWRNDYILQTGEWDYKSHPTFNRLSARKTPHSVAYSEMVIIELNDLTKDKYFSIGAQYGLNSNGKSRNAKFKVNKRVIDSITDDSFVIYRYRP